MSSTTLPTETNRIPPTATPEIPIEAERILLRTSAHIAATKLEESSKNRISDALRPTDMPKADLLPLKNRLPDQTPAQSARSSVSNREETTIDRAYFPLRALLPQAALLTALSAGWLMGIVPYLPNRWQSPEVIASIPGAYALFLAMKWLFQFIGGGYRLTNRQILRVIPGPIPDPDPIDLVMIADIQVEQSFAEKLMFVGHIRVMFERDILVPELLGPIGWPKRRVNRILDAIEAARSGNVVALKAG